MMTAIVLATLLPDLTQPTVTASLKRASNTPEDSVILITWLHKSRKAYDKTYYRSMRRCSQVFRPSHACASPRMSLDPYGTNQPTCIAWATQWHIFCFESARPFMLSLKRMNNSSVAFGCSIHIDAWRPNQAEQMQLLILEWAKGRRREALQNLHLWDFGSNASSLCSPGP